MWKLDGRIIPQHAAFWHEGVAYPANWITTATSEARTALGLVWVEPQPRPDDRFYFVQDNGDGTFTATPRDIEQVKATMILQAKTIANGMLAPTDWLVIRSKETLEPVPDGVTQFRAGVRLSCTAIEEAILASTTFDELLAVEWIWPEKQGEARWQR